MVNVDELNEEIEKLEAQPTTYSTCEKLSILYTVLDHQEVKRSRMQINDDLSEFCNVAYNLPREKLIAILDSHMTVIKAIYPKEYELLLSKMREQY